MQGEYRGDFTRDTFQQANHFCRVLMQQGRVQLDADWNEQTSILLHFLRNLGADLIGQHGGPGGGFLITPANVNDQNDLQISPGHYYVDGILCEAGPLANAGTAASFSYLNQPNFANPAPLPASGGLLVYLDVWERHVTYAQNSLLREVALGGPDTATRAMIVWQIKIQTFLPRGSGLKWPTSKLSDPDWQNWIDIWQPANRGLLQAQVQPQAAAANPCVISPMSAYRGVENQLYRVEIHTGNVWNGNLDANGQPLAPSGAVTFKWSRENGSVAFPILNLASSTNQTTVTLGNLGRDLRLSVKVNDWVEIVDDVSTLSNVPRPLLQVTAVDLVNLVVTLSGTVANMDKNILSNNPLLRRWDQQPGDGKTNSLNLGPDGGVPLTEGIWLNLEDGIQIQFQKPPDGQTNQYRSDDYWLIPARVATGDIEWPKLTDPTTKQPVPAALPPHGIEHHYAPLALIPGLSGDASTDLRRTYAVMAQ